MTHHLAQINIARGKAPLDSPVMHDFVALLDEVNALAEASPGFVWRLKTEGGNATDVRLYDDPLLIVNLSVWTGLDALRDYTYRSPHGQAFRRRREWFDELDTPGLALWWIPAGTTPAPAEGRRRLEHLARHGPTPEAFTFREAFPAP